MKKKHHAKIQCVSSKSLDRILNLKSLIEQKSQEIIPIETQKEYKINIMQIGPPNTGKTSIIERIIKDSFNIHDPTVLINIQPFKVELKNHSSIIYYFFDISGQENFIPTWIDYLDKIDIIIFVNDKKELQVNTTPIEKRVLLSDKKIICCINKKDLFSDGENEQTLKSFKNINDKLK